MEGYSKRKLCWASVFTFSIASVFSVQALAQTGHEIYKPRPLSEYTPSYVVKPSTEYAYVFFANTNGPAVSYTNAWVGASLGDFQNSARSGLLALGDAGITVPIGNMFGLQFDGSDGVTAHQHFDTAEGFLFTRNPMQGLFGPHVKYQQSANINETLYGLRGDAYIYNWTFTGEGGGVHTNIPGINGTFYAEVFANWYTTPNLKFNAGYMRVKEDNAAQVGGEYQLGLKYAPGLSVFATGGFGSHNLGYGFLGLNYYFGDDHKTLIQRHREDTVTPTFDPTTFKQIQVSTRFTF